MATIADRIAPALLDPGPTPTNGRDLVAYTGGRRAFVEAVTGMSRPPRQRDYPDADSYRAARTSWRSATQRARRYDTGARGKAEVPRLAGEERARVREAAEDQRRVESMRRGMRARMRVKMKVDTPSRRRKADERVRTMPSGGPGVLIPASVLSEIMQSVEDGEEAEAGGLLLEAFFTQYGGLDAETAEIEDVYELSMWPDGTEEP